MNDAFGMRGVEAFRDLDGQIQDGLHFHGVGADAMFQRHAVQIFHDDEGLAVLFADFVNGANVGVIQSRSGFRFAAETFERLTIARDVIGKELKCHETVQAGVLSFVDHTHPAAAQFLDDAIMREGLADHRCNA